MGVNSSDLDMEDINDQLGFFYFGYLVLVDL